MDCSPCSIGTVATVKACSQSSTDFFTTQVEYSTSLEKSPMRRKRPGITSYGHSNPMGYQTSDFRLLWAITPNPQPPKPPMIGLCPPPPPYHTCALPPISDLAPPPFLLPNSAPCFLCRP